MREFCVSRGLPFPDKYSKTTYDVTAGYKSLAKYDRPQPALNERAWLLSGTWMERHFDVFVANSTISDTEEALSNMDLSTSPGYPWSRKFPSKKEMIEDQMARAILNDYWDCTHPYPIWTCSVKGGEMRTHEKIRLGKLRTFTAAPIEHTVALNRMCYDFNNRFYQSHEFTWSRVGFSKFKRGWEEVLNTLKQHPNGFALDGSSYDASLFRRALFDMADYRFRSLRRELRTPDNKKRMFDLYAAIVESLIVLDKGDLIFKTTGNPSGSANTVVDNTMILFRLFAYAWIVLAMEQQLGKGDEDPAFYDLGYHDFVSNVSAVLYGDDNTFTTSERVVSWFNAEAVMRVWKSVGLDATTDDPLPRKPDDLDFLSQHFRYDTDAQCIVPVPETQKVLCSLAHGSAFADVRWHLLRAYALRNESWGNLECRGFIADYIRYIWDEYRHELRGVINDIPFEHIQLVYKTDSELIRLYAGWEAGTISEKPLYSSAYLDQYQLQSNAQCSSCPRVSSVPTLRIRSITLSYIFVALAVTLPTSYSFPERQYTGTHLDQRGDSVSFEKMVDNTVISSVTTRAKTSGGRKGTNTRRRRRRQPYTTILTNVAKQQVVRPRKRRAKGTGRARRQALKNGSAAMMSATQAALAWKQCLANPFENQPIVLGDSGVKSFLWESVGKFSFSANSATPNLLIYGNVCSPTTNTAGVICQYANSGTTLLTVPGSTNAVNWANTAEAATVCFGWRPVAFGMNVVIRQASTTKPPKLFGGLLPNPTPPTTSPAPASWGANTTLDGLDTKPITVDKPGLGIQSCWIPCDLVDIQSFSQTSAGINTSTPYLGIVGIDSSATIDVTIVQYSQCTSNAQAASYGFSAPMVRYTVSEFWDSYIASGRMQNCVTNQIGRHREKSGVYGSGPAMGKVTVVNPLNASGAPVISETEAQEINVTGNNPSNWLSTAAYMTAAGLANAYVSRFRSTQVLPGGGYRGSFPMGPSVAAAYHEQKEQKDDKPNDLCTAPDEGVYHLILALEKLGFEALAKEIVESPDPKEAAVQILSLDDDLHDEPHLGGDSPVTVDSKGWLTTLGHATPDSSALSGSTSDLLSAINTLKDKVISKQQKTS